MSTVNPTHIIAEGMREVATEGQKGTPGTRDDGQLWGAFPNTMTLTDLATHVVSKLTDAGYSIMQPIGLEYAPCWQNEHGVHPLNSTTAWRKGAEDDVERLSADDPEIFLGVHYRTPWVAAAAEGEKP